MKRRDVLTAGAVTLAAPLAPMAAQAAAETPIARMHREIIRLRDIVNDEAVSDEVSDAAYEKMAALSNEIVDIPARDLGDMMLKFMGHTTDGDHETGECPYSDRLWAEARALVGV